MSKIFVMDHPLIKSKITMLRNVTTKEKEFREIVSELATLICYEATRNVSLIPTKVMSPICEADGFLLEKKFAIVTILRAGIGMVDGMLNLLPTAKVGHIGLYRDPETMQPIEYYCKLPKDISTRDILVIDPMLATGGTASMAVSYLKDNGASNIKFLCLISCEDGVNKLHTEHPDIDIYTAVKDKKLNKHKYIIPGLGDAGDRLFGTK
jgi:uracil phosphoribosyltransferase